MALIPWEPFEELLPLREAMNRLFEESYIGSRRFLEPFVRTFPVDVREMENEYVIEASLPGVKPEELQITAIENSLTIHVTRTHEEDAKKAGKYVRRERFEGDATRTIALPTVIDPEKVSAMYEHGVLMVHVPKIEAPKPVPIQVKVPAAAH